MDDNDLIFYYKDKAKEWIYQRESPKFVIEDDEILDLDSLSLSSNEDTWLSSSCETSDENATTKLASSNFVDEELNDMSASFSPIIDVNNCSDSLIHFPDINASVMDRFLARTPHEPKKSKSYLQTILTNQFHNRLADNQNEISTSQKTESTFLDGAVPDRKHYSNDEKSYVLHSVENKLFTITDADAGENYNVYKNLQNRDYMNGDCKKIQRNERNTPSPDIVDSENKIDKSNEKVNRVIKTSAKVPETFRSPVSIENNENVNRSKKCIPLCQSTPMLLNRYLKYNKTIEETKNFSKWRTSSEFLKDIQQDDYAFEKNEMNVSYITESRDSGNLPHIEKIQPEAELDGSQTNLNTTYSKSDCVLNSTYEINIEDDLASSTSESSTYSLGNKQPLSIKDVQKMADMQEKSLQKQIYSSYYAGSSKSSEISSSNESISALSPSSSSNDALINSKIRSIQPLRFHKPNITVQKSANDTFSYSRVPNVHFVKPSLHYDKPGERKQMNSFKETKLTSIQKNKVSNISPRKPVTKEPSRVNVTSTPRDINESVTVKEINLERNSTFSSKAIGINEEIPTNRCSSGPVSHIPRPSSRIPTLRASSSCTRYSKSSSGFRK